mmetsp:Transcript_4420/g.28176  ORF Transcript_4420/g.28176 Transcript_4420/m.28176 type:complete len:279 (+) Transcript_4420:1386-2222(+)
MDGVSGSARLVVAPSSHMSLHRPCVAIRSTLRTSQRDAEGAVFIAPVHTPGKTMVCHHPLRCVVKIGPCVHVRWTHTCKLDCGVCADLSAHDVGFASALHVARSGAARRQELRGRLRARDHAPRGVRICRRRIWCVRHPRVAARRCAATQQTRIRKEPAAPADVGWTALARVSRRSGARHVHRRRPTCTAWRSFGSHTCEAIARRCRAASAASRLGERRCGGRRGVLAAARASWWWKTPTANGRIQLLVGRRPGERSGPTHQERKIHPQAGNRTADPR